MSVAIRRMNASRSIAPMTANQQGLWFVHLDSPATDRYHLSASLAAPFGLRRSDVVNASAHLLERHPVLRTWFGLDEHLIPRQYEDPEAVAEVRVRTVDSADDALALRHEFIDAPFDLSAAPAIRFLLVLDSDGTSSVTLCVHHIVADGRSLEILVDELRSLLEQERGHADRPLPPSPPPFAEYARDAALRRGTADIESMEYWRAELSTARPTCPPPPAPTAVPSGSNRHLRIALDAETTDRVDRQCFWRRSTLFCLIATLLAVGLGDCVGQNDVVFGTMLDGRPKPRFQRSVGYFVNTVAIRAEVDDHDTLDSLMRLVRNKIFRAVEHQQVAFSDVLTDAVHHRRDGSRGDGRPFVSVAYSHLGRSQSDLPRTDGLRQVDEPPLHARLPLEVNSQVIDGRLQIMLNFQTCTIDVRAAVRIAAILQAGLQDFPGWCDRAVRDLRAAAETSR